MKKILLSAILLATMGAYAQNGKVGIGNTDPKASLDVTAEATTTTTADGIIAPRLTGAQLRAKNAVYLAAQTGAQVYVTAADTAPAGKTVNVTAPGYYYYDGTEWKAVASGTSTTDKNIYDANGTLAGNRTVTQGVNTLDFTATAVDAFSVDGTTFSVDASNNRVGIGTEAPESNLHISSTGFGTIIERFSSSLTFPPNILFRKSNTNTNGTYTPVTNNTVIGQIKFSGINEAGLTQPISNDGSTSIRAIAANNFSATNWGGHLAFFTQPINSTATTLIPERMRITSEGNVGIGTTTPAATLDVVGAPTTTTVVDGIIAPRLTGVQLRAKNAVYTADQTGAQVYITAADTAPAGKTVNVTAPGYYYYDGTEWQKVTTGAGGGADTSIYAGNGTLAGNRTVTQGANTLDFTATAVDAFSVDGTTFSVDASNNRVGIGTAAPAATLDVAGAPATATSLDGVMPPRVSRAQLAAKTYTAAQNGAIVFVSALGGTASGQVSNVTAAGFLYFFDGPTLKWAPVDTGDAPTESSGVSVKKIQTIQALSTTGSADTQGAAYPYKIENGVLEFRLTHDGTTFPNMEYEVRLVGTLASNEDVILKVSKITGIGSGVPSSDFTTVTFTPTEASAGTWKEIGQINDNNTSHIVNLTYAKYLNDDEAQAAPVNPLRSYTLTIQRAGGLIDFPGSQKSLTTSYY